MGLKSSISIFWSEDALYILIYFIYALLMCLSFAAFEYSHQSTTISLTRLLLKTVILTVTASLCFTLSQYISGWHSRLLGAELLTSLGISIVWFILMYKLNLYLIEAFNPSYVKTSVSIYLIPSLFIAPFVLFTLFIQLLAIGFKN